MSGFPVFGEVFGRRFGGGFGQGGGGSILPLTIDFSAFPNGSLPSPLNGSTWAIVSGKAVNTPTLGAEKLTDPGLEAAYVAGLCSSLSKTGSPTVAESADAHEGTKAQEFTGAASGDRLNWPFFVGAAGQWYQFSVWAKRTAGSSGTCGILFSQTGMQPNASPNSRYTSAAYAQRVLSGLSTTTNNIFCRSHQEFGSSGFDTVIADDGSCKAITTSSLFAMLPATQADVIGKIMPDSFVDDTYFGIIIGADAQTSPGNYIMVTMRRHTTTPTVLLVDMIKRVGSTYTTAVISAFTTVVANAWLEVRRSGSTVKIYYNNVQLGSDQTVSDAAILAGTYHGFFSTGGNMVKQTFFQAN